MDGLNFQPTNHQTSSAKQTAIMRLSDTARIFLAVVFSILVGEILVHAAILPFLGKPSGLDTAVLDGVVLTALLFPFLIWFVYRPFAQEIAKRRKSEAEYRTIFETSPNAILAVVDETGKILRVNPKTEEAFGYTADELIGLEVEVLIPEHLRGRHRQYRFSYMKAPTARPMGAGRDLVGRRKDGSEFPVEIALSPMRIGSRLMILTTITDITARKSLEIQRDQAVSGAKVGMWEWDFESGRLEWSDRCKRLFLLNPDTIMTYEVFLNAIDPADRERVDRTVRDALEQKKDYEVEIRVPIPGDGVRWVLSKGRGYYNSQGKAVRMSGIALDITEQKRAMILRDEVVAIVSHDLKNPLAAIDLNVAALERRPGNDDVDEFIKKRTRNIRRTARQMVKLLDDLLDVTRLESGKIPVDPKEQRMLPIVEEALMITRPIANEKRIKIEAALECDEHDALCDHNRMVQVFTNLIGNAIKFTPEGGTITLNCMAQDGYLEVAIADTGSGIAPEEVPHIFDRFWQASKARKAGVGLGLAIVKGIVEAHGGRVWIESALGVGTTVHFSVPTRRRQAA